MHLLQRAADLPISHFVGDTLKEYKVAGRLASVKKLVRKNKVGLLVWGYIFGTVLLSQLCLRLSAQLGVYAIAASFAMLAGLAIYHTKARLVAISASLLPVVTMVNLSLPQQNAIRQAAVFYCALLLLALVYRFMFTLKQPTEQTSLGFKGYALVIPLLIVAGQILGVAAYGLLRNTFPFAGVSLPVVTAAMIVFTIAEEMTFRGLIQRCATSIMHPVLALVLTAGLYTAMTIPIHNIAATLFAAVASLVLSFAYYAKPNLILTIAANATFKLLFLGLILTFR